MRINAVYRILDEPRIWLSTGPKQWDALRADGPAYLITHAMWWMGPRAVLRYARLRRRMGRRGIELVTCVNAASELPLSRLAGLRPHLLNHNLHVCEHVFRPLALPRTWDAVYTAAANPYKRIHLAAGIAKLCVITYFWPDVRDENGEWNLARFEPRVAHAHWNRTRIERAEVNEWLSRSGCGLALSAREGAMFASMEYLLAGLPVVTTRSRGGRDHYFDPRHTVVVKANVEAVRRGVAEALARNLSPEDVRARALAKVMEDRRTFHAVVASLAARHGRTLEPFDAFHERIWGPPDGLERVREM